MNIADIMRQMENLKREQMNNNTRIAQEQRSVDNYERQANEYKRQANEYERRAAGTLRQAEPYKRRIGDLQKKNLEIDRRLTQLNNDYRREIEREKRK